MSKIPQEIIEYQADALEIRNERLPVWIRLCVWLPLLCVALAIVWACLSKVDVVVQATGRFVTDRQTIVMKPLERSVIKTVNVQLGQVVHKDQVLITFDPTINEAEAERLRHEMSVLEAQMARLRSEASGKDYAGGADEFGVMQLSIFHQRQQYYHERMEYFKQSLLQITANKKNKEDYLAKQRERLEIMRRVESMYADLSKDGTSSILELLQVQINRMEIEANVNQLQDDLVELEHRRGMTLAEQNTFVQEWNNKISEDLVTVDRNLMAAKREFEKVQQLIEYVCLRSPCDAVVHEIAAFSEGSAVREAEALITLIPMDGNLEVEAELRSQDIGRVMPGAAVRVKLTAYPYQKHGVLEGIVRNISENTFDKGQGEGSQAMHGTFYRVRIPTSGKLKGVTDTFRLIPGMEVQCDIKCGQRRVIEYVLYPLIKAFDEAAREP